MGSLEEKVEQALCPRRHLLDPDSVNYGSLCGQAFGPMMLQGSVLELCEVCRAIHLHGLRLLGDE